MSYPRLRLAASVLLIGASSCALATNYDFRHEGFRTAPDADGYCSLEEAVSAMNLQQGTIAGVSVLGTEYWSFEVAGVQLDDDQTRSGLWEDPAAPDRKVTIKREARNLTRDSSIAGFGRELSVKNGDEIEVQLTFTWAGSGPLSALKAGFYLDKLKSGLPYDLAYVAGSATRDGGPLSDALARELLGGGDDTLEVCEVCLDDEKSIGVTFKLKVSGMPDSKNLETCKDEPRQATFGAECPAGGSNNSMRFETAVKKEHLDEKKQKGECPARELPATYELENELTLDGNYSLSIGYLPVGNFDNDPITKQNFVLKAPAGQRIFNVESSSVSMTLTGVTLEGSGPVTGDGGLILTKGGVALNGLTKLHRGEAENGGALYLDGGRLTNGEQVLFEGNTASDNGGAIATSSDQSGSINLTGFHFLENNAGGKGSAIYLGKGYDLTLKSGTLYLNGNDNQSSPEGTLYFDAGYGSLVMNNMTVFKNFGGGLVFAAQPDPDAWTYRITNSALIGNGADDCSVGGGTDLLDGKEGQPSEQKQILAFVASGGSCGPTQRFAHDFNYTDTATGTVAAFDETYLNGPMGGESDPENGPLVYFLPVPLADTDPQDSPTLAARGSYEDTLSFSCEVKDIRGFDRTSQCDIGAAQRRIASGAMDEFKVIQGHEAPLDVLKNDLGDMEVNCALIPVGESCLEITQVPNTEKGFVTRICTGQDFEGGNCTGNYENSTRTLHYTNDKGKEDSFVFPSLEYPVVMYRAQPDAHGVDSFAYRLKGEAIVSRGNVEGVGSQVNVVIAPDPRNSMAKKEIGSWGLWGIMLSALLGLRRTSLKGAALALVLFPVLVSAATLRVNTLKDLADGEEPNKCSLRRAIAVAHDDNPAYHPGCGFGSKGFDQIMLVADEEREYRNNPLPEYAYELCEPLEVAAGNRLEIIGKGPGNTIIRPAGSCSAANSSFRLFTLQSEVTFANLTLTGGEALRGGAIETNTTLSLHNVEIHDNKATGTSSSEGGGAVFLNYHGSPLRAPTFNVTNSYIHANTASRGAFVAMVGPYAQHRITIDNSTFEGNSGDSLLGVTMNKGGGISSINSTYIRNNVSALFDLVNAEASVPVSVLNNTLVEGQGALFKAASDKKNVHLSHSILDGFAACMDGGAPVLDTSTRNILAGVVNASTCNTASQPANEGCGGLTDETSRANFLCSTLSDLTADFLEEPSPIYDPVSDRYTPPHYTLGGSGFPIDAGLKNPAPSTGDATPSACRHRDLRGTSRPSGAACDIGAYELNSPTANDDQATNQQRFERAVQLDLLLNDSAGDSDNPIDATTLEFAEVDSDGKPTGPWRPASNAPVDIELLSGVTGNPVATAALSLEPIGSWEFSDFPAISLTDNEVEKGKGYTITAVIYNRFDEVAASTRQRIVFRKGANQKAEDDLSGNPASTIRIDDVGAGKGIFVLEPGTPLTVKGYTDLLSDEDESLRVEVYWGNDKAGETTASRLDQCDANHPCVTRLEFTGWDPATISTDQQCQFLSDGLTAKQAYRFHHEGAASSPATFTATITHIPPRLNGGRVKSSAGKKEEFKFDFIEFPGGSQPVWTLVDGDKSPFTLSQAPKFVRETEVEGEWLSFMVTDGNTVFAVMKDGTLNEVSGTAEPGLLLNTANNTITYQPANVSQEFNDSFILKVVGSCGQEVSAEYRVEYPNQGRTQGAFGSVLLVLLLPLAWRRRQR